MIVHLATFPMHLDGFLDKIGDPPAMFMASRDGDIKIRHRAVIEASTDPVKILCSFHFFRKINFDDLLGNFAVKPMIFADSGAYSAASQGVPVGVDEYAEWLHRWKHYFATYANLDVIRDPIASQRNQKILEREGLAPIPVFHTGSDFSHLDDLAEIYPYIALGGMVGQSRNACLKWSATCMKRTAHRGTRFHGFGMTSKEVIESLPWYSVDSSSWVAGAKFGRMMIFDGRRWHQAKVGNPREIAAVAKIIRSYGFDPAQFSQNARYKATQGHINISIIAALSWQRYEKVLQARNKNLSGIFHAYNGTGYYVETDKAMRRETK